jgi:hypothetical protein
MSRKSRKDVIEKFNLPDTVDGICSLVRQILNDGAVRRIELDTEDVVRVVRTTEVDSLEEPMTDWDYAVRNVEDMVEYSSAGASAFQVLVDMPYLVQKENLKCVCFVTGNDESNLLEQWLELRERGMPTGAEGLLGHPLYRLRSLPEEALILLGSRYANPDPSEISFAVKTTIEVRSDDERHTGSSIDGGVRSNPQVHSPTTHQLAVGTGGLRRVPWKSSGVP